MSSEKGRASLSKVCFSSSSSFTTTIVVLLLTLGDPPFQNVTGLGLLDSKSYANGCDVNRFTILTLLLDITG